MNRLSLVFICLFIFVGIKAQDIKEKAVFGGGCFWCMEAVYERIIGVKDVTNGYAGGKVKDASYKKVIQGNSKHAEVIEIIFDSQKITYEELLEIFFASHDPTTLNRQGYDVGEQYRSVIFYLNDKQKKQASTYINNLTSQQAFKNKIVTQLVPLDKFFTAEYYHQNYYENNPNQGYCSNVIAPKIKKIEKIFKDKLKKK